MDIGEIQRKLDALRIEWKKTADPAKRKIIEKRGIMLKIALEGKERQLTIEQP